MGLPLRDHAPAYGCLVRYRFWLRNIPGANGYLPRYGCSEISTHSLQELASVTVDKLQQWHLNLPAELKADEGTTVRSPLPHVLTLQ